MKSVPIWSYFGLYFPAFGHFLCSDPQYWQISKNNGIIANFVLHYVLFFIAFFK